MSHSWLKTVNEMVVEYGERRGYYFLATLTSGQILKRLGAVISVPNHRNVKRTIEMNYPGTKIESIGINGSGGWTFHMKVRSK
jgi:hypothetical protein